MWPYQAANEAVRARAGTWRGSCWQWSASTGRRPACWCTTSARMGACACCWAARGTSRAAPASPTSTAGPSWVRAAMRWTPGLARPVFAASAPCHWELYEHGSAERLPWAETCVSNKSNLGRMRQGSCRAGGKRDPTDVSAEATAVREMTEETGGEGRNCHATFASSKLQHATALWMSVVNVDGLQSCCIC